MSTPTHAQRLRALADHIDNHNLDDSDIISTRTVAGRSYVQIFVGNDVFQGLLRWSNTLGELTVEAEPYEDTVHLHACGNDDAGYPTTVVVVASGRNAELVGESISLADDESTPVAVDVLRRLAGDTAEAVTA